MGIEFNTFPKKRTPLKRSFPTGTVLFTGAQGAGKTLSATHYLVKLKKKYPDMYIYSNITLNIADEILDIDEIGEKILDVRADGAPIAFFLDEIQTVLFKSGGKNNLSLETFRAICQQRKANKTIIGTLQEFLDLDIDYRRQLNSSVSCLHFGALQLELWRNPSDLKYSANDNDYIGKVNHFNIWKRHNDAYNVYDTFEIVSATLKIDRNVKLSYTSKIKGQPPI